MTLLLVQALNGVQLGLTLFLIAAGLTLVFGVMDFINLAHGVQYMVGAYLAVSFYDASGSFLLALVGASLATGVLGLLLEALVFRRLMGRGHLDQVLATFGLILTIGELVRLIWGTSPLQLPVPRLLSGAVPLMSGMGYPVYRIMLIVVGLAVAGLMALVIGRTKIGMQLRAGASNAAMVNALGVDIHRMFRLVFGVGAMLAGFAGVLAAPLVSVEAGMSDNLLILAFVVIVVGGVGSVRGAFIAAILVGLVDTLGRSLVTALALAMLPPMAAGHVGPALASMLIYLFMAAVLAVRPAGLFGVRA